MKIQFIEYLDDLEIIDFEYNAIHLINNKHSAYLIDQLRYHAGINKNTDFDVMNIQDKVNILYVPWDFQSFANSSLVDKQIQLRMAKQVEEDVKSYELFEGVKQQLESLLIQMEDTIKMPGYNLSYNIDDITIQAIVKLLKQKYVSILDVLEDSVHHNKRAYIEFMCQYNTYDLIIVEYPETMSSTSERVAFAQFLRSMNKTVLVITNSIEFFPLEEKVDNAHVVDTYGKYIDLPALLHEGLMFTNKPETFYSRLITTILNEGNIEITELELITKIVQGQL